MGWSGGGALADLGFTGLDPDPEDPVIITGWKSTATCKTIPSERHANQALSAARAPVEHSFSDLKNWRIPTRLRLDLARATTVLRALPVLTRQHHPLTDDHDLRLPAPTSPSTASPAHTSPLTMSNFGCMGCRCGAGLQGAGAGLIFRRSPAEPGDRRARCPPGRAWRPGSLRVSAAF